MIETRLNGAVVQHATTDQLIFDVAALIAIVSEGIALEPGDVVVTEHALRRRRAQACCG